VNKAEYRSYFSSVREFLKMSYFLRGANVNHSNFSRFMKGKEYDYLVSREKLEYLHDLIRSKVL
jgi:hypothetical protein